MWLGFERSGVVVEEIEIAGLDWNEGGRRLKRFCNLFFDKRDEKKETMNGSIKIIPTSHQESFYKKFVL